MRNYDKSRISGGGRVNEKEQSDHFAAGICIITGRTWLHCDSRTVITFLIYHRFCAVTINTLLQLVNGIAHILYGLICISNEVTLAEAISHCEIKRDEKQLLSEIEQLKKRGLIIL